MNDLVSRKPNQLVDAQAQQIVEYLKSSGLPSENIIATLEEREIMGRNLPSFVEDLPPAVKNDARYLSKFVVGAGFGLFDYSLNAIWNEVIVDLRRKATNYGLDIFFDAAVGGGKGRDSYQTEDDLRNLKDGTLLYTCRKLELIADPTYSKLKHILDMRNNIGISHPNSYNVKAFELMGWLQTCVEEVLKDQPSEAALQVQQFIRNLKDLTNPIDDNTLRTIEQKVVETPTHFCGNILRTVFGIFVSPDTDIVVRANISQIAPCIWNSCIDEPKYKLGSVLEGYKANLHTEKYNFGQQFFDRVGGNAFRSESERQIIINELLIQLKEAHNGYDNFYTEVPFARSLASYLPEASSIIPNIAELLFRIVILCRMGNGYGVSNGAKNCYDQILSFAGDKYVPLVMASLSHYELRSNLTVSSCRSNAKAALAITNANVINQRLIECLDYLIDNIEHNPGCVSDSNFRKLAQDYITWQ